MDDSEIAFPYNGDAIENRGEQDALRQYPRCHECEVADVARRNPSNAAENLTEYNEPEDGLHRPREQFGWVAQDLFELHFRDRGGLREQTGQRG
jgi:hypothetical protein